MSASITRKTSTPTVVVNTTAVGSPEPPVFDPFPNTAMLFDKLALAESISSLPAANGIQNHPLTAKASPNAKVLRRKTIAVDSIHAEAEQIDSGVLG